MPSQIVIDCSKALADRKLTIAFAESATAGRLAAEFALTPYSGQILIGGLVCYDATIKEKFLGVSKTLVEKFTPESAEVTEEMTKGLKNFIYADVHVGITGLTTPGGSETSEKPVGSMFIHAIIKDKPIAVFEIFTGNDVEIVLKTVDRAAGLILAAVGAG